MKESVQCSYTTAIDYIKQKYRINILKLIILDEII